MKLKNNIYLFYIINFLQACAFTIPIRYFFFVNFLHFWIWNAIFIRTLSWIVELFFEVHSWGWADRYGRKKVFIFWTLSIIFWLSFYLWTKDLYLFFLSAFFIWFWNALTTGNLEALIHDDLEEQKRLKDYHKIQSNQYIIMYLWRATSSLVAWYLFFSHQVLPYFATSIFYIISLFLTFFICSPKQELSQEKSDFYHIKKALIFIYSQKNLLLLTIFLGFIFSWTANVYWFTYQPYLEKIWINIKDIGIIYFFVSLFSASGSYIVKKIKVEILSFLQYMFLWLFVIGLMFYYFDNIFWIIPILFLSILFGFIMILGNTYLIKFSPKTHKSTILSIFSLSCILGESLFWSISWYIAQFFSLDFLYTLLPFWLFFIFIAYNILYKKLGKE